MLMHLLFNYNSSEAVYPLNSTNKKCFSLTNSRLKRKGGKWRRKNRERKNMKKFSIKERKIKMDISPHINLG